MIAHDRRQFSRCASHGRAKQPLSGKIAAHGNAALHNHLYASREDQLESLTMGFLTEMFSRPRPKEQARYRAALAVLHAMSNADRSDIGIKPADFPRIAREMAVR
jgi:uncharacterized protein YjiS (DUF1127 family)